MDESGTQSADSLSDLAVTLRAFARARDWEQYHTPKNLAMALAGETGELLACFQWLTPDEAARIMQDPGAAAEVESERCAPVPHQAGRHPWDRTSRGRPEESQAQRKPIPAERRSRG
jgi:hypothetical protein